MESTLVNDISEDEIIPIEPYEYNGNEFFQQLHDNGTLWVPSEQKMIEDEKLQGKIKRAKLRLLQKRKEEEAEAKILRILNNADNTKSQGQVEVGDENMLTGGGGEEFDDEEEEDEEEEDEMLNSALRLGKPLTKALSKKEMLVDRIKDKTKQTVANIQEKIKRSKLKDLEHEARLDVLRQENEKSYLDSTDYEKFAIIDKFAERVKQRNVDEIFQRPDFSESEKNVDKAPGEKQKPYELLYAKEPEDKENVDINEDALFRKMRHVYDITKNHPYQHYEEYCDDLIREHVDNAKDCDTLLNQGLELVFMYERQQLTADDHVNKRVDMNAVDDDDEGDDASDKANRLSSSKQPGPNKLQTVDEEDEDE
ncbi:hypothetical protein Ocin01_03580 [Orchesella cincta]|uniref:Uncharacterized protein n=1 Tax=Orchesella cincta TaxID=48709 RepID=A0A1D2NCW7_ORCCI|nr:hypothetical protein Ocin01_03580 [Orchesella cincta]